MPINRNVNIIKAIRDDLFRGGNKFEPTFDPYSGSIVIAMPGTLFEASIGDSPYLFDMTDPYDDMSQWVRAGNKYTPGINEKIQMSITASVEPTASVIEADTPYFSEAADVYYSQSVLTAGVNSIYPSNKTWGPDEGVNISFNDSFVIESWIKFVDAPIDFIPGAWQPYFPMVAKYNPADVNSSQYLIYTGWGGFTHDEEEGGQGPSSVRVSGSAQFAYSVPEESGSAIIEERYLEASSSFDTNDGWHHWALVFSSSSLNPSDNHTARWYRDGNLIAKKEIPTWAEIPYNTEVFQVMGYVDGDFTEGGYNSSTASFQDFRLYYGTDKNYTGSYFTPPGPMVKIKDEFQ